MTRLTGYGDEPQFSAAVKAQCNIDSELVGSLDKFSGAVERVNYPAVFPTRTLSQLLDVALLG